VRGLSCCWPLGLRSQYSSGIDRFPSFRSASTPDCAAPHRKIRLSFILGLGCAARQWNDDFWSIAAPHDFQTHSELSLGGFVQREPAGGEDQAEEIDASKTTRSTIRNLMKPVVLGESLLA